MVANVFDAAYYRFANPDLAAAGLTTDEQLRNHFLNFGANEGRAFSPFINLNYYRISNPDLGLAGITTNRQAFDHLQQYGVDEGRRPSVVFNPTFYRAQNPDLVAAGLVTNEQLYNHYKNFGLNEGRVASEFFNPRFYLEIYPDLKAAGLNFSQALSHFINNGSREGRLGSGFVAPVTNPGSATSTAYGLGILPSYGLFENFVGPPNPEDYYSFTLDKTSNLNLGLFTYNAPITMRLFADANKNFRIDAGEELNAVTATGGSPASLTRTLGAGLYYLDVLTGTSSTSLSLPATSVYDLYLNSSPSFTANQPDPGNTPATAVNLDTLTGIRTVSDFVGSTDREDFYRFVLGANTNFSLNLSGASEPVVANLFADRNNNGAIDAGELVNATSVIPGSGVINQTLAAGVYYVDVVSANPLSNTNYTMSLIPNAF
jgi:hypothetical protein